MSAHQSGGCLSTTWYHLSGVMVNTRSVRRQMDDIDITCTARDVPETARIFGSGRVQKSGPLSSYDLFLGVFSMSNTILVDVQWLF